MIAKAAKGLGRGFESLFPMDLVDEEFDLTASEDEKVSTLVKLPVDKIVRDEGQPRREFKEAELAALAASIKEHGVLQPIIVTKEEDFYKLVAGERRWRAAKLVGLETIPAIIRTLDAQHRLELSVIENAQREDLNAIELATAYAKLKGQFNLSPKEIARRVGKSEASIINTMRLLNLPEAVKKVMVKEGLSEGVMRPLVSAEPELIERVLPKIVEEGWTARKVERFVADNKKRSSAIAVKENTFAREEELIGGVLGVRAKVRGRSITLTCRNEAELHQLLDKLSKKS